MNKLDKLIEKSIEDSYVENYYPEFSSTLSESLISDKIKEITSDVAIKFAEWIANVKLHGYSKQLFEAMIVHKVKTTQELFEYFIKNYYENN